MFFSDSEAGSVDYYDGKTRYGKMVLRQAMALDCHPHQILSARLIVDVATFKEFLEQDERLAGQQQHRADNRLNVVLHNTQQLADLVDDATADSAEVERVANQLNTRDKRGKEV